MNVEGYAEVQNALYGAEFALDVSPQPQAGKNERFVAIETKEVPSVAILNVLDHAGLIYNPDLPRDDYDQGPKLQLAAAQDRTLIFEDRNTPGRFALR